MLGAGGPDSENWIVDRAQSRVLTYTPGTAFASWDGRRYTYRQAASSNPPVTASVGITDVHDGFTESLSQLVQARPELRVYILLWDYSVIYAAERELFPRLSLQWMTPERVTLADRVPWAGANLAP